MMTGPNTPSPSDRETLSALLDGELQGDARRFALRRLEHDPEWQQAASRWQLAGDVLQGQPVMPAPSGFAGRVAAAVAAQATPMTVAPPISALRPARRTHARWIGGAALAASVAMVALFALRAPLEPVGDGVPLAGSDTGMQLEPIVAPTSPQAPVAAPDSAVLAAAEQRPDGEGIRDGVSALAAAAPLAVAAIEAGQRRDERTRSRGQQQRAAARARQRGEQVQVAALAAAPDSIREAPAQLIAADVPAASPAAPFVPADEIVVRPWPRALPGLEGRSAFTASFDAGPQTAAPSFYPFEPRLPPELREQLGVTAPALDEPALQQ